MSKIEFKQISIDDAEIKLSSDGDIIGFTGYASVFGGVDSYDDTIHPGAYDSVAGNGLTLKMYFNHGWLNGDLPIGKMTVKPDERGLFVESAEFTPGIKLAEEVYSAVKHKTINGLSIGFKLSQTSFKWKENGGRDIYKVDELREISVVDYPADSNAFITNVKSAIEQADSLKEIEGTLRDAVGLTKSEAVALVSRIRNLVQGDPDSTIKPADVQNIFKTFKI